MTRTNHPGRFVRLGALVVALGGCGGGAGEQADAPGKGAEIVITNFVYSPSPAEVRAGQPVTVTNEDSSVHTLTVPGGIDSGSLTQGKSFTFTPTEAGTVDYLCDIHQYMKGRIVVR